MSRAVPASNVIGKAGTHNREAHELEHLVDPITRDPDVDVLRRPGRAVNRDRNPPTHRVGDLRIVKHAGDRVELVDEAHIATLL